MTSEGISLILVDDTLVLRTIAEELRIDEDDLVPLDQIVSNLYRIHDVVFYTVEILPFKTAERYMSAYNIKRGIIAVGGKKYAYGRDLQWLKAILVKTEAALENKCLGIPVPEITEVLPEDRDDPYTDLGYQRK